MRSLSASLSENFLHAQYPDSYLPPLWDVIYQEAMRGHHLLFRRTDVERYDSGSVTRSFWEDDALTEELEIVVLKVIGAADLQAMVKVIDALPDAQRRDLYVFYRRTLWMWQHYVKSRLN